MRSVSKETRIRYEALMDELNEASKDVTDAHQKLEDAIREPMQHLISATEAYNQKVMDLNDCIDEIIGEIDDFMSDKSDKWLEGDVAQQYEGWKETLENHRIEQVEVPEEEVIECPDVVVVDEVPPMKLSDV
jgi:predicted component of type VI protein secretion system